MGLSSGPCFTVVGPSTVVEEYSEAIIFLKTGQARQVS